MIFPIAGYSFGDNLFRIVKHLPATEIWKVLGWVTSSNHVLGWITTWKVLQNGSINPHLNKSSIKTTFILDMSN